MSKLSVAVMFLGLVVLAGLCAPVATGAEPARPKQLDLSYVSADVCGVVVLHPQQMARSPEVAALLKNEHVVAAFKQMSFDPLKIEQMVGLIAVPTKERSQYPVATLLGDRLVVRFSPPVDADSMAKLMLGGPRESRKIVAATVAGKRCYKFEEAVKEPANAEKSGEPLQRRRSFPPTITCVADDRTVLVCVFGEADLKKMLAGGEVKSPLVEPLRRVDVSEDIVAAFALEPVRESIKEGLAQQRQFAPTSPGIPFSEMSLLLQSAVVKVNLTDVARTSAILEAEDAAGAAKVEELVKTVQQTAKDALADERKRLDRVPEEFRKSAEEGMSLVEKLLDAMTWAKSGAQVTVTLKGSKGLMGEVFAKSVLSRFTSTPAGLPPTKSDTLPAPSARQRPPSKSPPEEK